LADAGNNLAINNTILLDVSANLTNASAILTEKSIILENASANLTSARANLMEQSELLKQVNELLLENVPIILLSVILSVLAVIALSRKTGAQQLITIQDIWGGVFIGFLVGYFGNVVFDNLIKISGIT
jgi:hypothetical protein